MTRQPREEKIRATMVEVDRQGGIVKAIAEGHVQSAVSRQAYERHRKIESGEIRKVGVNCYRVEEEDHDVEFHPFKEEDCAEQVRRLERVRAERDQDAVASAVQEVLADAKAGRNVMPAVIKAVKSYATVGELTNCFVQAYGRYQEPVRF